MPLCIKVHAHSAPRAPEHSASRTPHVCVLFFRFVFRQLTAAAHRSRSRRRLHAVLGNLIAVYKYVYSALWPKSRWPGWARRSLRSERFPRTPAVPLGTSSVECSKVSCRPIGNRSCSTHSRNARAGLLNPRSSWLERVSPTCSVIAPRNRRVNDHEDSPFERQCIPRPRIFR